MALLLSGELGIVGPGVSARLSATGHGPATLAVEGALGSGRRVLGPLARRAAGSGLALTVRDGRGRRLAEIGPDVRSLLGRLLVGTSSVRPTFRGLVAAARGAAAPPTTEPGDR